jgi:hypothetical protein
MSAEGPFPRAKSRPGRDYDHSTPSSVEVENEQELYILSTQAPSWRVVERFSFILDPNILRILPTNVQMSTRIMLVSQIQLHQSSSHNIEAVHDSNYKNIASEWPPRA